MKTFIKDPDSVLDYSFDWTNWLTGSEIISNFEITTDSGIALDSSVNSDTEVTVWLSGGTAGESYKVSCKIFTDSSPVRTEERTMIISVEER